MTARWKIVTCFGVAFAATAIGAVFTMPVLAHGSYTPTCLFFPYAMLALYVFKHGGEKWALALGLSQFFLYAAFYAWRWVWEDDTRWLVTRIAAIHLLVGIGAAVLYGVAL